MFFSDILEKVTIRLPSNTQRTSNRPSINLINALLQEASR